MESVAPDRHVSPLKSALLSCDFEFPVKPTSFYCFPLYTTLRHILNVWQFLSREIVHSLQYFFRKSAFAAMRISSAICCAHTCCQLPHFVAVFSLPVRHFFLCPPSRRPPAKRISVLHFAVSCYLLYRSTKPKELDPWNGPRLGTKKLT
jgi:hypothetical protein